jgi:histidinol dehydrogenase
MKVLQDMSIEEVLAECQRPLASTKELDNTIEAVFNAVKEKGDEALIEYTEKFDKVRLAGLEVANSELENAETMVDVGLKIAIKLAAKSIRTFHESQISKTVKVETAKGVICWQESRAIQKIGIYIPAGTAPLFSTVLMLGIPAQIARCSEVILCTPPNSRGNVDPCVLYAAKLVGVTRVFKVGGAQAIAALTLGTSTIPSVYKIFGPGNQYVTAAKMKALQFGTAIDMPAGPSELMLIADKTSNPAFAAADLLSQAEHGIDSQVICLVSNRAIADDIIAEIQSQLTALPRKDIAQQALQNSRFIVSDKIDFILTIINEYAPEHLILTAKNNERFLSKIQNAGSVFIGEYTPESAGDYASGTNHTLPTNGSAKAYSGVNLDAFVKKITFQEISKEGIQEIGPAIEKMAQAESLQAHKNAVSLRLKAIKYEN